MADREKILSIKDLKISFKTDNGKVNAIRGVDFDLYKGETIAIVGESGSGKSVTTKAIMGIMANNGTIDSGTIEYHWNDELTGEPKEVDIAKLSENEVQKEIRGRKIAMVFQDPMTSLNPTTQIGKQIMEPMKYHYKRDKEDAVSATYKVVVSNNKTTKGNLKETVAPSKKYTLLTADYEVNVEDATKVKTKKDLLDLGGIIAIQGDNGANYHPTLTCEGLEDIKAGKPGEYECSVSYGTSDDYYTRALELLELVGITDAEKRMKNYPHQLSGGMRQRVVIAIALSCDPYVLICDEPTTALDVTIQAKILELIQDIQKKENLSVIYITHDLGVVAKVADYINVMYAGRIVEKGTIDEIFYDPRHPYTWGLLSAMPDLDTDDQELYTIPGTPPNLAQPIKGDAFAPRNRYALNIDLRLEPPMFDVEGSKTHKVASWLMHPNAPKVEMPKELKNRLEHMEKAGDTNGK
ncbi:MAG: ABC transporter ATP-binding protein [Thomasclavelia sp.]|jgi:oligopeptide/dipeptide ABC transporter ATP-binding protein|nr:ABC transporter ATP-binding protein [Thomasclavelia sp.]